MLPFLLVYSVFSVHLALTSQRIQVQVAGLINGLEITMADGFTMGVTNRSPEFLAKFPMGKVPAFEGADGFCIAEGAAIAMYVAGSGPKAEQLLGPISVPQTRARIAQWICFAENELVPNAMPAAMMCVFKMETFDQAKYDKHALNLIRALKRLNVAVQGGKKFLVGDHLTLADIMVAGPLFSALGFLIDAEMKKEAPDAVKYWEGLAEIPELKQVFGELKSIETRVKPTA